MGRDRRSIRIGRLEGRPAAFRAATAEAFQTALHEALDVTTAGRPRVIAEHPTGGRAIASGYLGMQRSADAIQVQVTRNKGRDAARKQRFRRGGDRAGVPPAVPVTSLAEVDRADWSFGNREAQLA